MFYYRDLFYFTKVYTHKDCVPRYLFVLNKLAKDDTFLKKQYNSDSYICLLKSSQQAAKDIVFTLNDESNEDKRVSYFVVMSEPYKDENNFNVFLGFPMYWQSPEDYPHIKNLTDKNFAIIPSRSVLDEKDLNSSQNSETSIDLSPHLESRFPNKAIIAYILHFLKKAILKNAYSLNESHSSGGYCSIPDDESSRLTVAYDVEIENGKRSILINDLVTSNIIFV